MSELHARSATELAALIRAREVSPVQAVNACIERIREVNPAINAVVATRYAEARAEAERAEAAVLRGDDLGPLHGVPCTIKEFLAVRGLPHTGGIKARAHVVAERDATVVRRLRQAGAIVLGVSNAPEGGLWHETTNPVYGRTRNPHDLHRTSGGSSGGEGAIVAAGGSPFGLGSDVGGSIRFPAAFCGVVGHKPTGGLVPNTGHFPHAPRGEAAPMVVGPLARHVVDLELVLEVIAGPDGVDRQCRGFDLGPRREIDWSEVTVHALPTNGRFRPTPEVAAAVHKAAKALVLRGARLAPWRGPDLSRAFELWAALLSECGQRYHEIVGDGLTRPDPLAQMLRWTLGRADHSGGVIALMLLEQVLGRWPGQTATLARQAETLRDEVDRALGPSGLILHPTYPRSAPRHRAIALRSPLDVAATALFNVTESPVTVVRVDSDAKGLPVGIQVAGARGADRLCLAAGRALESDFGVPRPVQPRWGRALPLGLRLA